LQNEEGNMPMIEQKFGKKTSHSIRKNLCCAVGHLPISDFCFTRIPWR